MRFKRTKMLISSQMLLAGLLVGCSTGENEANEDKEQTIKVMHYDERSFNQQYGMLFSAIHPNISVEVVSTQSMYNNDPGKDMKQAMLDFIEENKPDVLMLTVDQYRELAAEGKLYNLDTFIQKDKYDLEGMVPGIVDYIKGQSDGILYGLAPTFSSQALFYNKDLFTQYGVTPPADGMSWEELLQLAARFPTTGSKEERIYGLKPGYVQGLYQFGLTIGMSHGLSFINPTTMQMTLNTDSWKKAFEMADQSFRSDSLYMEDPNGSMASSGSYESYLLRDPFISGKVAMSLGDNYLMDQIKEASNNAETKDKAVRNWDLVTVPVNPQTPDESTSMAVHQIFAIDAASSNAEAAWKFVSYINGDEFARVTSKVQMGSGMPVRTQYIADAEGRNTAAFYSLKPVQPALYKDYEKLPQDFFMKFDGLTQEEMKAVEENAITISEALGNLQAKGQELLIEENNKPAAEAEAAG